MKNNGIFCLHIPDTSQDWPPFLLSMILHVLNLPFPLFPVSFRILLPSKSGHYPWFHSLFFLSGLLPLLFLSSFSFYHPPTSDGSNLYFQLLHNSRHLFPLPVEYPYVYIHLYLKFSISLQTQHRLAKIVTTFSSHL